MSKRIADYNKIIDVYNSVEDGFQLLMACRMANNWYKMRYVYDANENAKIEQSEYMLECSELYMKMLDLLYEKKKVIYYQTAMKCGAWCDVI